MNHIDNSSLSVRCLGCDKRETITFGAAFDYDQQLDYLRAKGWFRRTFGPGSSPWFCGMECAWHSQAAKDAEALWKEDVKTVSRTLPIFVTVLIVGVSIMFLIFGALYAR